MCMTGVCEYELDDGTECGEPCPCDYRGCAKHALEMATPFDPTYFNTSSAPKRVRRPA
jgi:hypothetical protein